MERWAETTIGEVVEFHDSRRVPLNSRQRAERQGPYPYYGASGIIDYIDDYIFEGRYLLVAEDGENLNSRKLPVAFFANGRFWVNNHAHIIRGLASVADDEFLKHWFAGNSISGYVTGAAQPKLSQTNLKRMAIKLPPYAEQRRIADILSAYDGLIENNTRRIAVLEEMARRLYEEWFVHFRFPGHEGVKMVESEIGEVPEEWEVRQLYEVAEVTYGYPFKSKQFNDAGDGMGVIRIRDIKGGRTNTFTLEEGKLKHRVSNGDILIGMDGEFHMGKWTGGEAWLNQRVTRLRPRSDVSAYLLFLAVERPIKKLESTIVGTTVAHLSARDLKEMKLALPKGGLLRIAAENLEPMFNLEMRLKFQNTNLRVQRDLLLPKLISGEIAVSAIDELMVEVAAE